MRGGPALQPPPQADDLVEARAKIEALAIVAQGVDHMRLREGIEAQESGTAANGVGHIRLEIETGPVGGASHHHVLAQSEAAGAAVERVHTQAVGTPEEGSGLVGGATQDGAAEIDLPGQPCDINALQDVHGSTQSPNTAYANSRMRKTTIGDVT